MPKTYQVELDTPLTAEMGGGLCQRRDPGGRADHASGPGAAGENGPCSAVVVLHQGVYHQIKRMFGVYGAGVRELRRVAIGQLWLDERLGPGGWRELTAEEVGKITAGRLQTFKNPTQLPVKIKGETCFQTHFSQFYNKPRLILFKYVAKVRNIV